MDFRELTREEYDRKLRSVIVGAEGLHAQVQDVGDGRATIGWGYTLNRSDNLEIWTRSGIELTAAQRDTLERVDSAPAARKTAVGLTFDRILTEVESDTLFRASLREYEEPAIAVGMPLSDERVALVSVAYNRGTGALRGHPVIDAIRDGDRAEAWYQLRYNCWGTRADMEGGLRKRRFAESEVFGLYDDPGNVPVDDAANVYRMYRRRSAEIDRVERVFGVAMDGTEARPNRIAQANRDYPAVVADYGAVRTIADAMAPARTVMIQHLRERYPEHASEFTESRFDAAQIDLDRFMARAGPAGESQQGQPLRAADLRPGRAPPLLTGRAAAFEDTALAQIFSAMSSSDATAGRSILRDLASSPRGIMFLEHGERLLQPRTPVPEAQVQATLADPDGPPGRS